MSKSNIMEIEFGEQKSQPVLSIRAKVSEKDLHDHVLKCFGKISSYLSEQGVTPNGAPFIAYYNIDMYNLRGNGEWDMEVGFPITEILPRNSEIKQSMTVKGKTISYLYNGAYSGLGKAYSKLSEWLDKSKYHSMKISYEYFYNSPNDVPEEELLTRVVLLIK